jgi:HD-GYP domain-containing protein (c-di-GMP phosphodiesterase class II)
MALTLLVENNPKMIEIYLINLATYVGLEVVVAKTKSEAHAILASRKLDLIISRAKLGSEDVALELADTLTSKAIATPLFIIGHGLYPAIAHGTLPNGLDLRGVIKGAASALGITAQQMVEKKVEDDFPVPARYFAWITYPVCNLFLKDESGTQQLLCAALEKLAPEHWKNRDLIYVSKLDRLRIVNQITAELVGHLEDKELNPDEAIQAGGSNYGLLSQKLVSLGMNEETIALAQKCMVSLRRNVKTYPKLGQLLQRMLSNQAGYLYRHTQIVTYISLHIVRNIDWGTPEQEDKIAFISFFHDIALETDAQAQIQTKEQLRTCGLATREKALVDKHAQVAAELVHKYPHAPMGADQIIRQHHGMLNGIGFSDHFGANLSPMAIVFVLAEEFTRLILNKEQGPLNAKELTRELRETFPTSRFQKIIDLLEQVAF